MVCLRSFVSIGMNNSFFFVPSLVEVRIYSFFFASIQKNCLETNRGGIFKTFMEPRNRFQGIDFRQPMPWRAEAQICKCLRRPGIDSEELICKFQHRGGIFKQSMGTRNRVGIGLLYPPARARICKPFKGPEIDSQPGGPVRQPYLLYRLGYLVTWLLGIDSLAP